jgi:pilus assembly protein CpaB
MLGADQPEGKAAVPAPAAATKPDAIILLPPGEQAVAIKVSPDGTAGFIMPGSRVDVVAVTPGREGQKPANATILEDVEVLAVDEPARAPEGGAAQPTNVVTLRVTQKQAEVLAGHADATLRLVLRKPKD